jgi:hypothetical protein
MPINKNRNVAIASGLGFALNNYNENLTVLKRMARQYSVNNEGAGFIKINSHNYLLKFH